MLGPVLLAAARSDAIRRAVSATPLTRPVVDRFVAGERLDQSLAAVRELTGAGLAVTLDHLGEDVTDKGQVTQARDAYLALLEGLRAEGWGQRAELSLKLSAFGLRLPGGGEEFALRSVEPVLAAAEEAGTMVTVDMEDHTAVDGTLAVLAALRGRFPRTGVAVQSYLFRTEDDCRALAAAGCRVRLVKGAYREPASVAYQDKRQVDLAYVRALRILFTGGAHPMIATHDPRLIAIAEELARRAGRDVDGYEFQMLYGIRTEEQLRLARAGHTMRVYVPYGHDWYGYFMRRLAERPANLAFFARSLLTRG
ncbi:proline dehydrogenase family protein [Streptomyces harbinensis]|uniref:proline dehydrogenase family protein n=1 Tax=Streptomyces harbinensis TaxID=1176198 RepID=UPI0034DF20B7